MTRNDMINQMRDAISDCTVLNVQFNGFKVPVVMTSFNRHIVGLVDTKLEAEFTMSGQPTADAPLADAIEEMIKVSAMYRLGTIGSVARFTGAVLRGDKPTARKLWNYELLQVSAHLDDILNVEIELWLR